MNPSPTANRSFLHGSSRKAALISDKVVYATLDSLALKRARLPLQLLPADNGNLVEKTEKADKEKRSVGGKTSPKRPTYKVKSGTSHQWKSYSKYLVFPSTKSENQSARFAGALDTGTERYIANNLGEEIRTQSNPTVQESIETHSSPSTKEKSRIKNLRNDKDDLTYSRTERNSYNEANVAKSQRERGKCSIGRKDSSSSSDYERMDVVDYKVATLERTLAIDSEIANKTILETATCDNKIEKYTASPKIVAKSMSINDLATTDEDDDASSSSSRQKKKKKRRFTRNVLYYVPRHLVKQPKKKLKKKYGLSGSLSSLRSLQAPSAKITGGRGYISPGIGNLSREELKGVTISSPTNFVHVASATNPDLISNENTVRSSLEQVVITHQQICATLPLLVGKDERHAVGNENTEQSKVGVAGMSSVVDNAISSQIGGETTVESIADKSDRTNYAVIKSESFARDLQTQAAKVLETGQVVVKIAIENQADSSDGETYEPICESSPQALPPANNSFLWSNHRAKSFPSDRHDIRDVSRENADGDVENSEEYDDVGPSNFVAQAESDYDDVGPPATLEIGEVAIIAKDCEEIYDDVMPLGFKLVDESDHLIPGETDELGKTDKQPLVELRTTSRDRDAEEASYCAPDNNQYFLTNNEYSIVDESRLHKGEERDELGVYDDVGLPGEERVNSLYAGSTPGSVLGLTAMNGKESEWEDQEEVPSASHCPCRGNDSREKGTEGQIVLGKKRLAQRWSRNARRQWSRRSRRSVKTATRTTLDATLVVAVSLGGGSILLVGESDEKITGGWRSACPDNDPQFRTQGLVQLRVINLDEDVDTQETSCYVHEDSASDDSTYESLYSCQPDDFSTDSDAEAADTRQQPNHNNVDNSRVISACLECPTRPTPPPPREASLTQTLGRRIKMLRRTWSITKDSLGRIRRRTSVNECCDDKEQTGNEYHRHHIDAGKYFNFRRRFRKSIVDPPTFYLGENERDDICSARNNNNGIAKETIYTNSQYMGSGSDDSSKTSAIEVDHYSVLADQEPLYQFYAAAVARVAFESDSEGYEEVEDMMWKTRPAAADLARSGQRMLWCHTPQVIHSDLLQRLTPEEKKMQEAKFEILTSEASYLNSLRVLENEFLNNHALMNEILMPIEKKRLFDGVPSVLSASQTFLAELEAVWREDPMLPGLSDVLLEHSEKCQDTYVAYCSNQVSVDTTLKELRARKGVKFLDVIKRIEMQPACQNLSLHSFLMLPMQRVTRLPLLADAVLSKLSMGNSDRTSWEKVLSSLSNVVAECNEGARTAAQEAKMEALARKLEYSTKIKPIVLRGKQLIRSGSVVQLSTKTDTEYKLTFGKKFNKTSLYLLLLTDYLLVTKLKSSSHDESYTVVDACKRNLLALESASEESPFAGRNAMILTLLENHFGRHVEYILTCENNTERERWLEAVSPPKRELIGETLYESWDCPQVMAKYLYSPNQPDELSLQPGDVINVLRKMADGWYHGEKLLDGEQGWFPANYTKEVASEHVRARNLKQRHRLLALSSSVIQQRRAKQGTH